jgi:hypothetical protein
VVAAIETSGSWNASELHSWAVNKHSGPGKSPFFSALIDIDMPRIRHPVRELLDRVIHVSGRICRVKVNGQWLYLQDTPDRDWKE